MNFDLLKNFFNNAYFIQGTITITSRSFDYTDGHRVTITGESRTVKVRKVLTPVSAKDLADMGLGEYISDSTYDLYTKAALQYSSGSSLKLGDMITVDGDAYKLISQLNISTHGFYRYTITRIMASELNE